MVTTQEVVGLFLYDEEEHDLPSHRAVTVRMEEGRLAYIDSMAEKARVSRNVMVNHLLGLGINDVRAALAGVSPETLQSIEAGVGDHIGD